MIQTQTTEFFRHVRRQQTRFAGFGHQFQAQFICGTVRGTARILFHGNDMLFDEKACALLQLGVLCREIEIHAVSLPVKRLLFY